MKPTGFAGALIAAAALCGCAGSGGSGGSYSSGGGTPYRPPPADTPCGLEVCIPYLPRFPGDPPYSPRPAPLPVFTNWTDLKRDTKTQVTGLHTRVPYDVRADGLIGSTLAQDQGHMGFFIVQYDSQGKPIHIDLGGGGGYGSRENVVHSAHVNLAAVGQPWLDLGRNDNLQWQPQSPFTTLTAGEIELTANPYVLGWNHQSFGISNSTLPAFVAFSANTFGNTTHPSAVPPSGTATFTGKLAGLYVSPAGDGSIAAANLTVNADFSARSLGFASTGTTTTRDMATATPAPGLDLSGTLTYLPGSTRSWRATPLRW
jgi:hypothetical protein